MCKVTSKLFLTVISVIFWLAALALIFIGGWIFATYHHYDELTKGTHILVPACIMMAVGIFVFVLGCVGCIGAFKEQKCLLGLFFTILLIIFVGIVTTSVMAYVYRHKVSDHVRENMMDGITYYNQSKYQNEMDYLQKELHCCGVDNNTDWVKYCPSLFNHTNPYPNSCCQNNNCTKVNGTIPVYHEGCYSEVQEQFVSHLAIIAGVTAAFAVVQLLGMIASCVLFCRRKPEVPYIGLTEPSGMRV